MNNYKFYRHIYCVYFGNKFIKPNISSFYIYKDVVNINIEGEYIITDYII